MRHLFWLSVLVFLVTVGQVHAFGRRTPQFKAELKQVVLETGQIPVPCKEVRKGRNRAEDILDEILFQTDLIIEDIATLDTDDDRSDFEKRLAKLTTLRAKLETVYPVEWNRHDRGQAYTWVLPLREIVKRDSPETWKITGVKVDSVLLNQVPAYSQIQLTPLHNESQAVVRGYWPLSPVNACLTKLSLRVGASIELAGSQGSTKRVEVRLAN